MYGAVADLHIRQLNNAVAYANEACMQVGWGDGGGGDGVCVFCLGGGESTALFRSVSHGGVGWAWALRRSAALKVMKVG